MAGVVAAQVPPPGLVLCSTAARARQTYDAVSAALRPAPRLSLEDALYLASPEDILAVLRRVSPAVDAVLVVGHNPGLWDLARGLAAEGDPAALGALRERFPTGSLARLSTPAGWVDLSPAGAVLEAFVRPGDVEGQSPAD